MLNLLLDTHAYIWSLSEQRISKKTLEVIADGRNRVLVSAVTFWEIALKRSIGKLKSSENIEQAVVRAKFEHLSITYQHAEMVADLPWHHKDPFDRLLVAQAQFERLTLITADPNIMKYEVKTLPI